MYVYILNLGYKGWLTSKVGYSADPWARAQCCHGRLVWKRLYPGDMAFKIEQLVHTRLRRRQHKAGFGREVYRLPNPQLIAEIERAARDLTSSTPKYSDIPVRVERHHGRIPMASRNVRTSIEKDELVIRVKLDAASIKAAKPSSSGKSRVIGTTGGIKDVDGSAIEGLQMGLNVTIPAD